MAMAFFCRQLRIAAARTFLIEVRLCSPSELREASVSGPGSGRCDIDSSSQWLRSCQLHARSQRSHFQKKNALMLA
ncbi:hypothetical protein, partial [Pararhizobium haloflavum]|uniref:hypothetical protein n=1 Tax=Pararhizobium haloflavum TaxID=2037914 RepID=UPI001FE02CFF